MDVINSLQPPFNMAGAGIATPFGTFLPPGSRVAAYVYSGSAAVDMIDQSIANNLVTTLNAGLARCRSGKGDYVVVLPGHSENISAADAMSSLVAGTNIVGLGEGRNRPRLIWTAAAATFLFDVDNATLDNFQLFMDGNAAGSPLTVAAPITMSGNGCRISNSLVQFGSDADELVTVGVTVTGDDCMFANNFCYGATAAECTTFLRLTGADRFRLLNTTIMGATSAVGVGVVQMVTTASTDIEVANCIFANRKASSTSAFLGMAASTGVVRDSGFSILNDSGLVGFTTPGSLQGIRNHTVNLAGEQGGPTTPISV